MLLPVTRKFCRLLAACLLLFFVLPLLSFYLDWAVRPEITGALPLRTQMAAARPGTAKRGEACGRRSRIVFHIHDFYQNGL